MRRVLASRAVWTDPALVVAVAPVQHEGKAFAAQEHRAFAAVGGLLAAVEVGLRQRALRVAAVALLLMSGRATVRKTFESTKLNSPSCRRVADNELTAHDCTTHRRDTHVFVRALQRKKFRSCPIVVPGAPHNQPQQPGRTRYARRPRHICKSKTRATVLTSFGASGLTSSIAVKLV